MRSLVGASLVALALSGNPSEIGTKFDAFVRRYEKTYTSEEERSRRLHIFSANMDFIEHSNAKNLSYTLGITPFTDLTFAEWRDQFLTGFDASTGRLKANRAVFHAPEGFMAPDSIDWVEKGAVSSIKDQGHCGSCWTFSATGALEGAMFVAGRPLTELSQQNILDCDTGGNKCHGGSMDQAFQWVQQNGLCGADYAYQCMDQNSSACLNAQCNTACEKVLQPGDVTDFTDVGHTVDALEAAVAQQPVSVAIEADKEVFQHYTHGVVTDEACGSNLDHGVLAVGYGEMDGQKYWKVKNSWGTDKGQNGYWYVEKGSSLDGGECGIRKMASFPTVKGSADGIVV